MIMVAQTKSTVATVTPFPSFALLRAAGGCCPATNAVSVVVKYVRRLTMDTRGWIYQLLRPIPKPPPDLRLSRLTRTSYVIQHLCCVSSSSL